MTVVFGSRHFDCRRSRNGEISFRDLSASFAALTPVEMTVFSSLARDDGVLFTPVETTVVFSSCHFDCRRSRNGEISFRDLSASVAALTPVEVTVFFSRARDDGYFI
jgi:hypothetical protein